MTAEEAINDLRTVRVLKVLGKYRTPALDMAISALEKQIAKEPIGKIHHVSKIWSFKCPICNKTVYLDESYCLHCGQAICWED